MSTVKASEFKIVFCSGTSLIDVRAPVEYERGAFPNSVNLPVLNDEERHQVGIRYNEAGAEAAMELCHTLVCGETKAARIAAWVAHLKSHPDAMLYCFRGGQRSQIACSWLQEAGFTVGRIEGGYKNLRKFLLAQIESLPPIALVSGQTGCGKTRFLTEVDRSVDLESLANHRGSAFGGTLTPQPAQIEFENALAIAFLRLGNGDPVLLEDEGRLIGRIHLPPGLQQKMKEAPIIVIEASIEERTGNIYDEYITQQWQLYQSTYGDQAFEVFGNYLLTAVDAIRKRLGNVRHVEVRAQMEHALTMQRKEQEPRHHREWIRALLSYYYDPMYDYQLGRKASRIVFRGSHQEALSWVKQHQECIA